MNREKATTTEDVRSAWMERLRELLTGVPGLRSLAMANPAGAGGSGNIFRTPTDLLAPPAVTRTPLKAKQSGMMPVPDHARVDDAIERSRAWMLDRQNPDGHWVAELEADTTLESYFILFKAFFGKRDDPKIPKYVKVIREAMLPEGGWAIFEHGPPEISVSVLSYFAMKIAGVPAGDPDMIKSRDAILKMGGVAKANTYTKFHLAFFDQYDWAHVPAIPPEMIFLPSLAPINIYEMSSWSRTIFVPLSIIYALKPVCPLPPECHVDEIFPNGRNHPDLALPRGNKPISWKNFFLLTDLALKVAEKFPITPVRRVAMKRAENWMVERFERSGGLGAILPAMMNSVFALRILGYGEDHPLVKDGIAHLDALEIPDEATDTIRIQPCHSPVWDTCIATYALCQSGLDDGHPQIRKAEDWMLSKEVKLRGDWHVKNPVQPGGWYFEFENEFYPDTDDTMMVMMALRNATPKGKDPALDAAIDRGLDWELGMQNRDGGWGAFDRDNDMDFLTKIPFADHNAMIDPSTADLTSRMLEMFATVAPERFTLDHPVVKRAMDWIKADQCQDGSWYGRWGINYMYGTWQVLRGLRLIGEDMSKGYVRKAVEWLRSVQLADGGWGERADSYDHPERKGKGPSTKSQTAWALMGLLAAGQGDSQAVRRGVAYLLDNLTPEGTWEEDEWTGTGFPKVFYLKYHYYRHYFPLMALAQYRRYLRGERP
ncbi:MAG: squalene--hopene cyclase [Planctomycetes bacterium]|nr:squalene--hopene cyclase [Planctomycetota bacterium]